MYETELWSTRPNWADKGILGVRNNSAVSFCEIAGSHSTYLEDDHNKDYLSKITVIIQCIT